jgi:hypothetical protein
LDAKGYAISDAIHIISGGEMGALTPHIGVYGGFTTCARGPTAVRHLAQGAGMARIGARCGYVDTRFALGEARGITDQFNLI